MTVAPGARVGVPCTSVACMVNHSAGRTKGRPAGCRFIGQAGASGRRKRGSGGSTKRQPRWRGCPGFLVAGSVAELVVDLVPLQGLLELGDAGVLVDDHKLDAHEVGEGTQLLDIHRLGEHRVVGGPG